MQLEAIWLGMVFMFSIFTAPCPAGSGPSPQWELPEPLLLLPRGCSSSMIPSGAAEGPTSVLHCHQQPTHQCCGEQSSVWGDVCALKCVTKASKGQLFTNLPPPMASKRPDSCFFHPKLMIPTTSPLIEGDKFCTWPTNPSVQGRGNWIHTVALALSQREAAYKGRALGTAKALEKGRFRSAVSSNLCVQIQGYPLKLITRMVLVEM